MCVRDRGGGGVETPLASDWLTECFPRLLPGKTEALSALPCCLPQWERKREREGGIEKWKESEKEQERESEGRMREKEGCGLAQAL